MEVTIPRNHIARLMMIEPHREWKTYILLLSIGGRVDTLSELAEKADYDVATVRGIVENLRQHGLVDTERHINHGGWATRVFIRRV